VEEALSRRPELRAARRERDAAAAERRLAAREALPSPRLGVEYAEEGDPAGTVRIAHGVIAFDLPLFDRNQEARGVASARAAQADSAVEALERTVRGEVILAVRRLAAAREAARAYPGGLLEPLRENDALLDEAWRAGKVSLSEVLVFRRDAIEARLGWIDALEELEAARAAVARAAGRLE
ncbi:MAG TPA: TolC family protein, partial [Anaeromyxobacteraceae bacterium]|nr:TolC family protein [Anaeromyxobacteraceae bacterium]